MKIAIYQDLTRSSRTLCLGRLPGVFLLILGVGECTRRSAMLVIAASTHRLCC